MKLKFWEKEEPDFVMEFVKTIQWLDSIEFLEMYNSKTMEEQKLIRKKIGVLFDCGEEYKDALEYEIQNSEVTK